MTDAPFQLLLAIVTIAGSAIGAFIAVKLAFGKFRNERLWEARFAAYNEILGAVERISAVAEYTRAQWYSEPTYMEQSDWLDGDMAARRIVARHASVSTILLDQRFVERLTAFRGDLAGSDYGWYESLIGESEHDRRGAEPDWASDTRGIAQTALGELRVIADEAIREGL